MLNYDIILTLLFELLKGEKITAAAFARKQGVSPRTAYRYAEKLTPFLPLHIRRGRNGGIRLAESYRLPERFFTKEEYEALLSALSLSYQEKPREALLTLRRKLLSARRESPKPLVCAEAGDLLILASEEEQGKLQAMQRGLKEKLLLLLLLEEERRVEPHLLVCDKEKWYLYAYCHLAREFVLFPLERVRGVTVSEQAFRPRPLDLQSLSLLLKK